MKLHQRFHQVLSRFPQFHIPYPKQDSVVFWVLAMVSLEINLPFVFDQLDFHNCLPLLHSLERFLVPGGTPHPLVMMNNLFTPLRLMIRTITVGAALVYVAAAGLSRFQEKIKWIILLMIIGLHIVLPQYLMIGCRIAGNNPAIAHDGGVIQMEESMKMLLQGNNPYATDFLGTDLENWRGFRNNVVYHVPYMPGSFLFSIPMYICCKEFWGVFDQRLFYSVLFAVSLIFIHLTIRAFEQKMIALTIFSLNPLFAKSYLLGTNDIVAITALVVCIYFFRREKYTAGFLMLAIGCAVKQFAWFFVPFLLVYCFKSVTESTPDFETALRMLIRVSAPGFILFCIVVVPFVIWDPHAFIEDTWAYGSGGLPTSYPMQGFHGYGLATMLLFFRIVEDGNAYFPFVYLQSIILLPLLPVCLFAVYRNHSLAQVIFFSGFIQGIFMYLSRYFHGNFLGFTLFFLCYAFCLGMESDRHPIGER